MNGITKVIPRPTRIILGGREFLASEFRLGDLADLQAWIRDSLPDPFEAAAVRLQHGERDADWKRLLADTIDAQEEYPPQPGTARADRLLDSPAGTRKQLVLSLRRENPRFDDRAAEALYPEISVAEYGRFVRVAWGLEPMALLTTMVDGPAPRSDRPLDWQAIWFRYHATVKGPAPPFADLTVTQLLAWRSEGKLPDGSTADRLDWLEVAERRRAFFAEVEGGEAASE